MYMPPLPLDALTHRHVKVPRDAIHRKLSAQITTLPVLGHFLRFVLPSPLADALFRQWLDCILVPTFFLVRCHHLIASVATIPVLLLCTVTRTAVIGRYFLVECLPSFAIFVRLGIGFGGDEGFGLRFPCEGVDTLFVHFIGEIDLRIAGDVDYVEVNVVAVEGGEGYVEVDSHSFAEASIHRNMLQTLTITSPPCHPFRKYQNSHNTISHSRQLSTPFGTYGIIAFRLREKIEFAYCSCRSFGIFVIVQIILASSAATAIGAVVVTVVISVGVAGGGVGTTTVELLLL
mmetsp:Transcript_13517/g.25858  ORF Transcript_13517/g.25858 Transcript_13517/m.25858 type:complete len:289 (-) Transcript_13517:273-1139(-)